LFFYCCGSVASPQAAVWASTWAQQLRTCAHVDHGVSTTEATPGLLTAGAGGATTGLGNGLGTTIKYVRRTTSGAAGNGLGAAIKHQ
jgi:hypothetical protein